MKIKFKYCVPVLLILFAGSSLCAKDFEAKQKRGAYSFEIKIDRNPPIIGDNRLEIGLTDNAGASINNAQVLINYYMPPMPRMAPMNYTAPAELKGKNYRATLNFIMAGPWIIRVIATHEGVRSVAKFNVDVR